MGSQGWGDINDEAIMNALMNDADVLLNLDDFFEDEGVEAYVQEPDDVVEVDPAEEVVEVEPAEEVVEMEISGEGGYQFEEGVNAVDEWGAGEQGGGDENQEDNVVIHMYHVSNSDSEDSDYESDPWYDSESEYEADFYEYVNEYGFRTHELNSEGVCSRCHMEMPQNQLCN
jgi:hypothetical protein